MTIRTMAFNQIPSTMVSIPQPNQWTCLQKRWVSMDYPFTHPAYPWTHRLQLWPLLGVPCNPPPAIHDLQKCTSTFDPLLGEDIFQSHLPPPPNITSQSINCSSGEPQSYTIVLNMMIPTAAHRTSWLLRCRYHHTLQAYLKHLALLHQWFSQAWKGCTLWMAHYTLWCWLQWQSQAIAHIIASN